MLNLLIIAFVAFMAYWWATQGLFSAFLHLVLTIFAAVLALAVWEPIVLSWLIHRMPDHAWGVGLLVPFGMILLGLRHIFDRLIPGNQYFPQTVNLAAGGVLGFISGVITVGVMIIGLQMSGLSDLAGYAGWAVNGEGEVERKEGLFIQADSIAAGVLTRLSGGSMNPIGSDASLGFYHPDLDVESSLYHKSAFWTDATKARRQSIRPGNVSAIEDGYFVVRRLNKDLAEKLKVPGGMEEQLVIVGTEVVLQTADGAAAADEDRVFYATKTQVGLVSRSKNRRIDVAFPIGYIHNGQYQPLAVDDDYAVSSPRPKVRYHWVFRVAPEAEPAYLRLKQARVELPDEPRTQPGQAAALVTFDPEARKRRIAQARKAQQQNSDKPGNPEGKPGGAQAELAVVSDQLPFTISRNALGSQNVEMVEDAIRSGKARVQKDRQRVGKNLAINRIYSGGNGRIVQVKLGSRKAGSLLGQIFNSVTASTQPPVLVDERGDNYFAIGYSVLTPAEFFFDLTRVRSVNQMQLGSLTEQDQVTLYYEIPINTKVVEFKLGEAQSQALNLTVK